MTTNLCKRVCLLASLLLFLIALVPAATYSQDQRTAYQRAVEELRNARTLLQSLRRSDLQKPAKEAIREIDQALEDFKKSAVEGGKDLSEHPPADTKIEPGETLRHAWDSLDKAARDVATDKDTKELKERTAEHIQKAKDAVEQAIRSLSK